MNRLQNNRWLNKNVSRAAVFFLACLLSSCGSSADKRINIAETSVPDQASVLKVLGSDAEATRQVAANPIVGKAVPAGADTGNLLPVLFETETSLNLDYARASVELIRRMNAAFILPANIDVVFADCGIANAFYVPAIDMSEEMEEFDGIVTSEGGALPISLTIKIRQSARAFSYLCTRSVMH